MQPINHITEDQYSNMNTMCHWAELKYSSQRALETQKHSSSVWNRQRVWDETQTLWSPCNCLSVCLPVCPKPSQALSIMTHWHNQNCTDVHTKIINQVIYLYYTFYELNQVFNSCITPVLTETGVLQCYYIFMNFILLLLYQIFLWFITPS